MGETSKLLLELVRVMMLHNSTRVSERQSEWRLPGRTPHAAGIRGMEIGIDRSRPPAGRQAGSLGGDGVGCRS